MCASEQGERCMNTQTGLIFQAGCHTRAKRQNTLEKHRIFDHRDACAPAEEVVPRRENSLLWEKSACCLISTWFMI